MLLLALFLSSLSLPADIKNRTLHTIVTKPVRASEVVLGRIVGFVVVTTCLLVVMGAISYGFVERGLAHTHQLTADDLQPVESAVPGRAAGLQGYTSRVNQHRHKVYIDSAGKGQVEMEQGHRHELIVHKQDGKVTYEIGPAEGMLMARVPIYGKLAFRDRTGKSTDKGINVGDEWSYRGYIEGGGLAAAVWTFQADHAGEVSQRLALVSDDQHFPHLQGQHRERSAGHAVGEKSEDGEEGRSEALRDQGVRRRRAE